jgi:hypothetical protein
MAMKRASFALLIATTLLATAGCGIGDRLFYCHKPFGGDCNSCGCESGCCNGSGMTDGGSYPGSGCACGRGGCGNGACGAGGCGNGACGGGGCGPGGCGNGYGMNGGGPNDPNGGGSNDPNGYAHGQGPVPRGVGGQYLGAAGPPTGGVAYPYYTNRGPRDFLAANPPSIGP